MKTFALALPLVAVLLPFPERAWKLEAAEPVVGADRKIRLAIPGFASPTDAQSIRDQSGLLVDLLTSQLSASPGFELVERAEIERALGEATLSLGQMNKPAEAIKTGKLLRADWLLFGSFLKVEGTNSLLAKIVDAQTGVIRDLTCVAVEVTNALPAVETIARFVESSKKSVTTLNQRLFLAVGGIQDLSINNRFPDFAKNLRASLAQHYRGTRVAVLERAMVNPLLDELRLALGGLSEGSAQKAASHPAFVLVDGVYQSYQDAEAKVNVVLRIQKLGGKVFTFSGKEPPGAGLDAKIIAAIDRALGELASDPVPASRDREVLRHFQRGITLMSGPFSQLTEEARAARRKMLTEAIEEFQAALLLDPEHLKAKSSLAQCLMDPAINKKEQARDYYREVVATSADPALVTQCRKAIALSYQGEDDAQSIALFSALKQETTNVAERLQIMATMVDSYHALYKAGRLSLAQRLELEDERWRLTCKTAESNAEQGKAIPVYSTFTVFSGAYDRIARGTSEVAERHLHSLIPELEREFPRLKPYFISTHTRWLTSSGRFPTNVPPELLARYREMLDWSLNNPDQIFSPVSFYSDLLFSDLRSYHKRNPFEFAEQLGSVLEEKGRSYLRDDERDQLDIIRGYLFMRREQWQKALACFERVGDRSVLMSLPGPWGNSIHANARQPAEECRRRIAAVSTTPAKARPGPVITLGQPVVRLYDSLTFACDGPQVWVADGLSLIEYVKTGGQIKPVSLMLTNSDAISAIVATSDTVWIATLGDGLIALDKSSRKTRRYTINDGLLLPHIRTLRPIGDKLWIGFGQPKFNASLGGLSYLDLKSGRLTGFSADLKTNLSLAVAEGAFNRTAFASSGPLRAVVESFCHATPDSIWLSSPSYGLMRFTFDQNKWEQERISGWFSSSDANVQFLVLGCHDIAQGVERPGVNVGIAVLDRSKKQWRNLNQKSGLPGDSVQSVAIDGDKVWVGGRGWLALVDLPTLRVERTAQFGRLRVGGIQLDGSEVWFAVGGLLYQIPRN